MAQIIVSLKVVKPWWLTLASRVVIAAFAARSWLTGWEPSDDDLQPFADWYGRHLRLVSE